MEQATPLVWNPVLRQYLLTAPHRMSRREGSTACPFCEESTQGKIGSDAQAWLHLNDFPPIRPPVGEAYVVVYHRDHQRSFVQLTLDEVNSVTQLWRELYRDLASRYPSVMIFENSGESIGQTQHHPHGQAYGVSVIPPTLERELETVVLDDEAGRGCPFCRVIAEIAETEYQVAANSTWKALLPPFVRYPYETHLYPRRHVPNLAALLRQVVRGYHALCDGAMAPMPYLLGLHQLPMNVSIYTSRYRLSDAPLVN